MTEYLDKAVLDKGRELYEAIEPASALYEDAEGAKAVRDARAAYNDACAAWTRWRDAHIFDLLSAAEEVPTLRAALDQAVRERDEARGRPTLDAVATIDSLRAEVAGLRKDAERWRKFRLLADDDSVIDAPAPTSAVDLDRIVDMMLPLPNIDSALAERAGTGDGAQGKA